MSALFASAQWRPDPAFGPESALSDVVCWSRMQAEAGQDLTAILARKEIERTAGDGLFCWGVGNAPSRIVSELARTGSDVDVVFSVMKSRPKPIDVSPRDLMIWRRFTDADGIERALPMHVLVTSRGETESGPKRVHYALMCRSERPLALADLGPFNPSAYRNLGGTGAPIGASQVTALLRRTTSESNAGDYRINVRARLTGGYWVKLLDPLPMSGARRELLAQWLGGDKRLAVSDWCDLVTELRAGQSWANGLLEGQPRLL